MGLVLCAGLTGLATAQIKESEKLKEYDPKEGFTPARRNLTTALLKLAGSLEHQGSPEPYIRYVIKENTRIDKKYWKAFGGNSTSKPAYLTDAYVENLIGEWKKLEKPLKLEALCREAGKQIRFAIRGSWHKSFAELAAEETSLTGEQKEQFQKFIGMPFFKKDGFPELDAFYKDGGGYGQLSPAGKKLMSERFFLGSASPEVRAQLAAEKKVKYSGGTFIVDILNEYQKKRVAALADPKLKVNSDVLEVMLIERLRLGEEIKDLSKHAWNEKDSVRHSHAVKELFLSRFRLFEGRISDEGEKITKQNLSLMAENLMVLAHLEFMAGLTEKMVDDKLDGN